VTHIQRQTVDCDAALGQWQGYVSALSDCGWQVVELPRADEHPDGVFVEDVAVAFDDLGVVTRPGAEARQPEVQGMRELFTSLGMDVAEISSPGTLDGGDVLKVGRHVYVGVGGRSNADGRDQLRALVEPRGYTVLSASASRVLHLKSAVTALPDGTVIGYEPIVDDSGLFPRFLAVPEESGAHVVVIDDGRLLMAADCPRSAKLLRSLGYDVVTVDIGEFEKLEGCVTCLSIRLR